MEVLMEYDYPGKREGTSEPGGKARGPEEERPHQHRGPSRRSSTVSRRERSNSSIWPDKGYDTLVSEFEQTLILKALGETNGVKSRAAQILSMNRTTLIEKMKRLGIATE